MEDYTLYDFKDIRKLVGRQLKEERHKLEPNRYKIKKPKPKKILSQEDCVHILKSTDFSYAFTSKDLFYGYNKEISFSKYQLRQLKYYNKKTEIEEILGDIFAEFVMFIIQDIIDNNITFNLPSVGGFCDIHMKTLNKEDFIKYRQKGQYLDIDFLKSNFKVFRPTLYRYDRRDSSKFWETDIIIDQDFQKNLTNHINNGKVYYENTPKSINDYLLEFNYNYPYINPEILKKVIVFGWRQIYFNSKFRRDVFIQSDTHYIYFGNVESFEGNKPEQYYSRQLLKRLLKLYKTKEIKWDGYYYFCLQRDEYRYYFRPTIKNGKRTKVCRGNNTKYFYFNSNKLLFKHPDLAFIYYKKSRYMVRAKAEFDLGNPRYIRQYIPILNVENYEYKGINTLNTIKTTTRKYKILWAKKQR